MPVNHFATPLDPGAVAAIFLVVNVIGVAILFAVLWWLRRVPRHIRDRARGGRRVVTLDRLPRSDSSAAEPCSVTGVLLPDPGPEVRSPVTRQVCALFRVELDRQSNLQGITTVSRLSSVNSAVPVILSDATGSVLIDADDLRPERDYLTDTRSSGAYPKPGELFLRAERSLSTSGFVQREFVVPPDALVTLVGRMVLDDDGTVRPARGGGSLAITTKSPAELVAAEAPDRRSWQHLRRRLVGVGILTVAAINLSLLLGLAG